MSLIKLMMDKTPLNLQFLHAAIKSEYMVTMYSIAMTIKYPNGFFHLNGNLNMNVINEFNNQTNDLKSHICECTCSLHTTLEMPM